jgi:hypothetical protein
MTDPASLVVTHHGRMRASGGREAPRPPLLRAQPGALTGEQRHGERIPGSPAMLGRAAIAGPWLDGSARLTAASAPASLNSGSLQIAPASALTLPGPAQEDQAPMQDNRTADGGVTVNLDADMLEIFQRGLLRDVADEADSIKTTIERGLEYAPVQDVSADVKMALRLLGNSVAMLDEIGWGD